MSQPNKPADRKKSRSTVIIGLILLIVLGLFALRYFSKDQGQTPAPEPSGQFANFPPTTPDTTADTDSRITENTPSDPGQSPTEALVTTATACEQTAEEISAFFSALDGKDYINARELKGGSQKHFTRLTDKLLAKPPVVAREKESLTSILNNAAHLYRTLGKNDVALIKEILAQEGDSIESTMALFYRWSELAPKCEMTKTSVRLPLKGLYEYAGFFLNTLGGQSYLFRRETRVRLLGKYYSILVLDRANDASMNRYGIDIRPSVDSLLEEMKSTTSLAERDTYLARLILLRDKYLARYGATNAKPAAAK